MKLDTLKALVVVVLSVSAGAGCTNAAVANPTTPVASAGEAERIVLADGVELKISPEAGPDARRVVEMIQSEMRSRYIGAR